MNVFLVDLTHGGVKISSELAKSGNYENVYAYDLYNTLKSEDEDLLITYDVNIIKDLDSFKNQLKLNSFNRIVEKGEKGEKERDDEREEKDLIINPIHSSLNIKELLIEIAELIDSNVESILNQYDIINHHQATELVLSLWKEETIKQDVKTIEITGVKGKTSVAFLLKEIFLENNKDTLLLSSLGAYLFRKNNYDEQKIILQKDISITPANIINTIQLAKKIANPKCSTFPICDKNLDLEERMEDSEILEEFNENPYLDLNYEMAIFENSLGICGLADIGILTNLVENYSIAKGQSDAKNAKRQVFNSPSVVIEYETLNEFYPNEKDECKDKINSFSLNDAEANVYCESIEYDIDKTKAGIIYHDLKTIDGKLINGKLSIDCFAPGPHHILNVLAAATTGLALGIKEETIQNALSNFKGIDGRTNVREIYAEKGLRIIEEINPGINTKAIESSINMINDIEDYYIIIGGKYGVTCEEIDEEKLSEFLQEYLIHNPNANLILTDELGKSLESKIRLLNNKDDEDAEDRFKIEFIEDWEEAQNVAIDNNKNILFVYRSNYSQVSKR
ncbi:MAG: coenzyme F430 synthase [Methanobrevibacter olleyae]|uniref:Coenzyme F430 synthase n=1 Tax=Methanobrevibacter olleyae TaxID=294671 RepID=A0A8T3VUP0_METOL|nr:coenzyme F430 synthase [Methanobrevibacter olleyae]